MQCPNCGQTIPEGNAVCLQCGMALTDKGPALSGKPDVMSRIGGEDPDTAPEQARETPGDDLLPGTGLTGEERPDDDEETDDPEESGIRTVAAIIAAVVFIAVGVLVYNNLPESRFKRYIKKARTAYETGSYTEAAEIYHKALVIHEDSEVVLAGLDELYGTVADLSAAAYMSGRFETGVEEAKTLFVIKPDATEQNIDVLETAYRSWALYLAEQGTETEVDALLEQASSDLPQNSIERIRHETDNVYQLKTLSAKLSEIAETIKTADAGSDHASVFRMLEEAYPLLTEFRERDGNVPVRFPDDGGESGTEFNTDGSSIQVYVGGLSSGRVRNGEARTYFISSASSGSASYEFFESVWAENDPKGEFRELDYGDGPGEAPTGVITGTVNEGHYDGEIRHTRGDVTYNMRFSNGKVEVLDTVDPNGDSNNVVGYTDDGDNWLVFSDSTLSSIYGVKYLH